ncbi:hypothetical protein BGZ80_006784 [Entomortierella chlamydospora]|uniref:CCHC-type domain-containing protein n=1 Tax=Entomortierella chlamydospora TaxID=101097 RepID=A0A9P6T1Z6_9FUNG|nr:hypothetical protein BGZ80_006784 [Entomortierella chlamydospora]
MSSVKVLVVGSANGDLTNLCSKVGTINSKHGPFDLLLCTGNFFAKETPMETIDNLLENKLDFPITTYFIHGDNGVPGIIERRAARNQGEVCNNVFYLSSHGMTTTAQSVKIASLSGVYDTAVYEADIEDEEFDKTLLQGRYTKPNVDSLIKLSKPTSIMDTSKLGVDIFLSHEWPAGIDKLSIGSGPAPAGATPAPTGLSAATFSHPVANAAAALQPRYHFAASSGQFWERVPYKNTNGAEHATRFIGLGEVGNKNKQRWFYAFNLVPLANVSEDVLKATATGTTTTDSPLATAAELKRSLNETGSFFWDNKRARGEPPAGYICRRCNQPGHFIKDCTVERHQPGNGSGGSKGDRSGSTPEGYICKKCNQPGHFIKDCPQIKEEMASGARPPPEGYICKICNKPGHFIRECPDASSRESNPGSSESKSKGSSHNKRGADAGPPPPCWFCLSNPEVDKNLIVSIGTEMYVTMAKGQLPVTGTQSSTLIPGGGHVLLITINHYSSLRAVDPDARQDLESELKKYKEGIQKLYESKGAAMVTWELSQGGRMQHAHVQIMAIPKEKADSVEEHFTKDIQEFFIEHRQHQQEQQQQQQQQSSNTASWQDHLPSSPSQGYFKVELPNGKVLICPIPEKQWVDPQFGRRILAKVLDMPDRANWKNCTRSAEDERKDSVAFKQAFKSYDFTL